MNFPQTTRRSFLKATLAGGVAPLILPPGAWSAETKAGDRLTLGFIGVGKMNRGHLGTFLGCKDAQVVAVCDVDTNRRDSAKKMVEEKYAAEKASGAYKGCGTYNDFRELLARKDIDALVIATPDHWHALIAIAAANAGKDIYCEKPLTETVHEAWHLVRTIRKTERVFQTGSQQRSSPEFRVACELVRNGRIGKIERVEAGFGGPGRWCDLPEEAAEPGLDWNLWLGPAPMRPYNSILSPRGVHNHFPAWRWYREYGNGMITDWGAHHLDIAQWGLGADGSGPVEIIPAADPQNAKAGAKLKYSSGVEVTHVEANGVTFFGSDGTVHVNRGKFRLELGGKEIARHLGEKKDAEKPLSEILPSVEREYLSGAQIKLYASPNHHSDWMDCVRSRKRPICDVEIGASTVTACHLLSFSYYYGQPLQWDPKGRAFTGGTGDAKWLTREYRDPWRVA